MWLINAQTLQLKAFEGDRIPPYAILSHRWEEEEVSFKDMQKQRCHDQKGYRKIQACCRQALDDNLAYVWVDTCCIDKRSSAELSEAINSMFRWYRKSVACYAFLADINAQPFTESLWFTRGWTLQELLAPTKVIFFDSTWKPIGSKKELASSITLRTGIASQALSNFSPADYCVGQKMQWAVNRYTTRVEDRAYSLLGLFQINMPLLYGEGENAFIRLQREIMEVYNDASIFLTSSHISQSFGMLGTCPESFENTDFKSPDYYQLSFDSTNQGIVGTFYMQRYLLDIYTLSLQSKDIGTGILLFVRWDFQVKRFQRIKVDGAYFHHSSGTNLFDLINNRVGERKISIGKSPIEMVSSTLLSRPRFESYFASSFKKYLSFAGEYYAKSDGLTNVIPTPELLCSESNSAQLLAMRRPTSCLCIGLGLDRLGRQCGFGTPLHPLPLMVIYFGKGCEGKPTTFIKHSRSGPPTRVGYSRRECEIEGYCWHSDRFHDSPPAPTSDPRRTMVDLEEIDKNDHEIVQIGRHLQIHFVRQAGSWKVYVESDPEVFSNFIPTGWQLPLDRRVPVK